MRALKASRRSVGVSYVRMLKLRSVYVGHGEADGGQSLAVRARAWRSGRFSMII